MNGAELAEQFGCTHTINECGVISGDHFLRDPADISDRHKKSGNGIYILFVITFGLSRIL
jgi:hypothetical protein